MILVAALCAGAAWADPPQFSKGGFLFSVDYGPGIWALDRDKLAAQVGPAAADIFVTDAQSTHAVALSAGYNIKGHATLAADFTATGWNVFDPSRGGAGFLTGSVAWHPLELVWMNKEQRPFPVDASTSFGVGYGICGQTFGMDGVVLQWAAKVDYFFSRYFGVGVFARGTFLQWNKFYTNFNDRVGPDLPQGSGGAFWHLGIALHFRAGD